MTHPRSFLSHVLVLAVASAALVTIIVGCDGGREGDRCNPDLSHNDCNDGLTCQTPSTCVENYCCPTPASASTNAFCNGNACPKDTSDDAGVSSSSEGGD